MYGVLYQNWTNNQLELLHINHLAYSYDLESTAVLKGLTRLDAQFGDIVVPLRVPDSTSTQLEAPGHLTLARTNPPRLSEAVADQITPQPKAPITVNASKSS
jgi:hypothetical protein